MEEIYATCEWRDRAGVTRMEGFRRPVSVVSVMESVDAKGGTILKFNRVPRVG